MKLNSSRFNTLICSLALAMVVLSDPSHSQGSPTDKCDDTADNSGKIDVQRIQLRRGGCSMMVSPCTEGQDTYRTYTINSSGLFMVNNILGKGPDSSTRGSRVFYIFPRKTAPRYQVRPDGRLSTWLPNGERLDFTSERCGPAAFSGGQISVDSRVNRNNEGGVEFDTIKPSMLVLDAGWKMGNASHTALGGWSTFRDSEGNKCRVQNREIFERLIGTDNTVLKYRTDGELAQFLHSSIIGRENCRKLNLKAIEPPVTILNEAPEVSHDGTRDAR